MQPVLSTAAERIESATGLDGVAEALQGLLRPLVGAGPVRTVLSGRPLGHPLHPALVAVPIGAWASASMLDLTPGNRAAAQRLIAFGCLAALPTAAAGASDWVDTKGADRRVGLVHLALNDVALLTFLASWRSRRRGRQARGAALAMLGSGIVAAGGWLGGHLAYTRGVGVELEKPASLD